MTWLSYSGFDAMDCEESRFEPSSGLDDLVVER
jgi:hypothetical protein